MTKNLNLSGTKFALNLIEFELNCNLIETKFELNLIELELNFHLIVTKFQINFELKVSREKMINNAYIVQDDRSS